MHDARNTSCKVTCGCAGKRRIFQAAQAWFAKFSNCCEQHKVMQFKWWFKKENYNGLPEKIIEQIREMENIAVDATDNRIDKRLLSGIVLSILLESDYREELKLRIINAKSQIPENY